MNQLIIFPQTIPTVSYDKKSLTNEPLEVSFRELVPEINDTSYLTHSIYYYPAKFIPQVVWFAIRNYTKEGDWIIDPFAGSGTVGLEAYLCNRNAVLWDLNLLLNHIIPIKIYKGSAFLQKDVLSNLLNEMMKSVVEFHPKWSNIHYWYPDEMYEVLSKYWGWIKQQEASPYKLIIEAVLVKMSKQFSYAEHKTPKLFISKYKKVFIEEILTENWRNQLVEGIYLSAFNNLNDVNSLIRLNSKRCSTILYKGGVDSALQRLENDKKIDCLITSPPYLQAQEYIRTSKLDLYWLGYSESEIKKISRLEIPYRKSDRIIHTPILDNLKKQIQNIDLIQVLDSYFCHTISSLENAISYLKNGSKICIFVGNPKVDGIEVETWRILLEYFSISGYELQEIFEDKIKNRQLFGSRNNKNPDGMKSEFMLVLVKK